jgi:hypothetical protein
VTTEGNVRTGNRKLGWMLLASACVVGCRTTAEVPQPPSSEKVLAVLVEQLDRAEQASRSGQIGEAQLAPLSMSLSHLRGQLAREGKASEAQLAELDRIHTQLARLRRGTMAEPGAKGPGLSAPAVSRLLTEIRAAISPVAGEEASG